MSEREALARLLEQHPAYSTGNDQQDWFKALEAADAILASGWVPAERLANCVKSYEHKVEELAVETRRVAAAHLILRRYADVLAAPGWSLLRRDLLDALQTGEDPRIARRAALAPSDPATDTGGEGDG